MKLKLIVFIWSNTNSEMLKLERWQGPSHDNKVKQYEVVLSPRVSSFIKLIQS